MPCYFQIGRMIGKSGLALALANHFLLPDDKQVKQMIATYGPSGNVSLESANLQRSLENKLLRQLPKGGLMMFIKGWKRKVTPLGRLYCQLAVSGRPTNGTDYGLLPTPSSRDWKDSSGMKAHRKDGKSRNDQLPRVAFGMVDNGPPSLTERPGSLNPAFPYWLMGFSTAALCSMQSAMQSFRKSPLSS